VGALLAGFYYSQFMVFMEAPWYFYPSSIN